MPTRALSEIPLIVRMSAVRQVIRDEEANADRRIELFLLALYPPADAVGNVAADAETPTRLIERLTAEERRERKNEQNRAYYARRRGLSHSGHRRPRQDASPGDPRPLAAAP